MWAGEFVHVMRPLVYVVMLRRYGLTSWKPWLTMLALDAASGVLV
jgi:peroxin-16